MALGPRQISVLARTYAECGPGELFLIVGSSGYLEVSLAQGSAAKSIGCQTGAPAELMIEGSAYLSCPEFAFHR